jgi:hypothetical protein
MQRPSRPSIADPGDGRLRRWVRRVAVTAFVGTQLFLVVRAYWVPHQEFGFHMFSEASQWEATIVRVTDDGDRVPVDQDWYGYRWSELVDGGGLTSPSVRRHANGGVDNQLALLDEALTWVAANTPDDPVTRYLEADVTVWRNMGPPTTVVLRSPERDPDVRGTRP